MILKKTRGLSPRVNYTHQATAMMKIMSLIKLLLRDGINQSP
jgi:hypothetical protein